MSANGQEKTVTMNEARPATGPLPTDRTAIDPVCGMAVTVEAASHVSECANETFHFCSAGCKSRFDARPDLFLDPEAQAAPAAPQSAIDTCPMHREIELEGPGTCPICGMAPEPIGAPLTEGPSGEYLDFRRRFWIGAVLTVLLALVAMGRHLAPHAFAIVSAGWLDWSELILATPVVLWCGLRFSERGWSSVRTCNLNMFTLIAIGVGVAYGYSVVATVAPGIFPHQFRGHEGEVGVYYEAAAVIVTLVLLGQLLELRARERTGGAIRALLDLVPKTARPVSEEGERDVPLDLVRTGDRLRVRPGEGVPVDGTVLEGRSSIDESMITGEPIPEEEGAGDPVIGGSLYQTGSFVMRAERVGAETMLNRIVAMVAEAQRSQAGADVAVESAGITLVRDDLTALVTARRLSRAMVGNIRQNLFFVFIYNGLGVPVAAGVLYPFTGLLLPPVIAALAMSLSSVSVIANALRLRGARL